MRLNIHNLTAIDCLNCGEEVWCLVDTGIDGVRIAVEPCANCTTEKRDYRRFGQEPKPSAE